jgi:hypothetical protein
MPDIEILAVYPSRRDLTAQLRVMIDFSLQLLPIPVVGNSASPLPDGDSYNRDDWRRYESAI